VGLWVWVLGNQKDILCGCLTGSACVELVNEPKAFFFNEWEALGTLPQFPEPPLLACLLFSLRAASETPLMSVILLLIRGDVQPD
jgi:hypothetical protein